MSLGSVPHDVRLYIVSFCPIDVMRMMEATCRYYRRIVCHMAYKEYYFTHILPPSPETKDDVCLTVLKGQPVEATEQGSFLSVTPQIYHMGWKGYLHLYLKQVETYFSALTLHHVVMEHRIVNVKSIRSNAVSKPFLGGRLANHKPLQWHCSVLYPRLQLVLEPHEDFTQEVCPRDMAFFAVISVLDHNRTNTTIRRTVCSVLRAGVRWSFNFNDVITTCPQDFTYRIDFTVLPRREGYPISATKQYTTYLEGDSVRQIKVPSGVKKLTNSSVVAGYIPIRDVTPSNDKHGSNKKLLSVPPSQAEEHCIELVQKRFVCHTAVFNTLDLILLRSRHDASDETPETTYFCSKYKLSLGVVPSNADCGMAFTLKVGNSAISSGGIEHTYVVVVAAIVNPHTKEVIESHAIVRSMDNRLVISFALSSLNQIPDAQMYIHIVEFTSLIDATYFVFDLLSGNLKETSPIPSSGPDLMETLTVLHPPLFEPLHRMNVFSEALATDLIASIAYSAEYHRVAQLLHWGCAPELTEILNHPNACVALKRAVLSTMWGMMDTAPIFVNEAVGRVLGEAIGREILNRDVALIANKAPLPVRLDPVHSLEELLLAPSPYQPLPSLYNLQPPRTTYVSTYTSFLGPVTGVLCNLVAHHGFRLQLRETPEVVKGMLDMLDEDVYASYHFAILNAVVYLRVQGALLPRHHPQLVAAVSRFTHFPGERCFHTRLSLRDMCDFFLPFVKSEYIECVEFGSWCIHTMYFSGKWHEMKFSF